MADYVRDIQGRISQIGLTRPGQARQIVVNNVTYAAFGPATGWTCGNGRQLQRPLDLDYRPQAVHDPAAGRLSLGYGYDPVGSITELKNGTGSTVLAKYAYDALGRLTQTQDGTTGTPIETYAYDATGNRTALTTSAGTASYTYPATSHRLTAVDGEARSHDAAGNTTSIGSKAFTYNDANRMNAVKQGNATLESYVYNHRGERVLRTPAGGAAQITLYDEAGRWLGNYSATGQAQQQAIWLDNYPVALINMPATGVPELAYVQPDHLGTPRVVIDPARDVAIWEWSNKSEVFGNQIPRADPDGDGVAFGLALRFPGQQATAASGMLYNYQREYDPVVGRYSQSDPIGLGGGVSTYTYAIGNTISHVDPLGLKDSQPGVTVTETGAYTVDWRYYVNRTLEALGFPGAFVAGASDFGGQYANQRSATHVVGGSHNGWGGQDKYFHCMANCEAAQKGMGGSAAAQCISNGREWFDQSIKGDSAADSAADQLANRLGRSSGQMSRTGSCSQICGSYRPGGNFPY